MKLIERTNCPVCFNLEYKVLFSIPYKDEKILKFLNEYYENKMPVHLLKDFDYQLAECNECKLIFQKYIPDEEFSNELYDKIISSEASLKKKLESKILNLRYDKEIKLIKKIFKNKKIKILEFGAGWGFWASRALESGLDVDAFELSNTRIHFMKEKGINVIKDLKINENQYDFIYSDQTIEHIPDPHQIFKGFLPNLKKGGFVLLNYPTSFRFKNQLIKNYIPKKDAAHPLEHLNLFNRESFNYLNKKYELELINFKCKFNPSLRNLLKDVRNLFYFDNILIRKK
jgi:ubiquinone/menaquinone biosynthesis C-methylase UbiE|tara:strand:+ start:753 stop:1610 length:858 start_codon:yes stop_codon:yes gene_type:complete